MPGSFSKAYRDQDNWARTSILKVARVGYFSSDRAIREYARDIWKAQVYSSRRLVWLVCPGLTTLMRPPAPQGSFAGIGATAYFVSGLGVE